jgi:hypothetical protein
MLRGPGQDLICVLVKLRKLLETDISCVTLSTSASMLLKDENTSRGINLEAS